MDQEEFVRHMRQTDEMHQALQRLTQPLPLWAWLVAVMLALLVLGVGMARFTWQVYDNARQVERSVADLRAQPPRPTVHERLDALEERVRALEQRLAPSERP
jgi:hypothetical protein